jgi:WD40 repeat protein
LGTETGHVRLLALDDPPWIEAELRFGSASVTALALRRPTEPFALGDAGGVVWVGERKSSLIRKTKLSGTIDDKGARPQSQDGELTAHIEGAFDEPNRVKILDRRGRQHGATVKTFGRLVAFHPDGRRVAVVDRRGRLRLWDFERNRWHGATFPRGFPPRETDLLAFSADGSIVAAATEDTLSFHDVDRWAPLGQVTLANFGSLRLSFDPARGAFSLVSASTYSLYEDDTTEYSDLALEAVEPILFSDDPARWRRYACRLVRRSLTTTEWDRYVPGRPYRRTCQ